MTDISELSESIAILVIAGKEPKIGKYYVKRLSPKGKFLEIRLCDDYRDNGTWISVDDILDFEILGK